MVHRYLCR